MVEGRCGMRKFDFENWSNFKCIALLFEVGLLLNVIPAKLAIALGIPLYLDCIGTVLTAMLGGYLPAVIVGFLLNAINGLSDPVTTYYGVISILIAVFATIFFHKRFFSKAWKMFIVIFTFALLGGGLGSVFTYFLFGFNFGEGVSAPFANAFHDVMHFSKYTSQFLADIVLDVFDKSIIVVAAVILYHFVPRIYKIKMNRIFLRDSSTRFGNSMVRNPLLQKVVIIVTIAEVLLGLLASGIGHFLYREKSIRNYAEVAYGAAQAATVAIDVNKIDNFIAQGYEADGYIRTKWVLERIRESFPQTKFLYVYKFRPDGCVVVFDLDTDEYPGVAPGEKIKFDPAYEAYLPRLLAGEEVEPIVSNDIYGWLFMVYKPLKNEAGKTVAYVGVDIAMETIRTDEAVFFIKLLSLFFGLSILIMSVVIELVKRGVVAPLNKMSVEAEKVAEYTKKAGAILDSMEIEKKNRPTTKEKENFKKIGGAVESIKHLNINTHDEIEHLYYSINSMADYTYKFIQKLQEQSQKMQEQNERIQRLQEVVITEFAELVEERDESTGSHVKKTAEYVGAIAEELRREGKFQDVITDAYVEKLRKAAPMHDIGKIHVADNILKKNGKLTDEEFAIMKTHTTEGGKILTKMEEDAGDSFDENYLNESIEMAHFHHEKWDGSGYPMQLKGTQIPLSARIMAVADVFDALVAERVYKKGFSYEKAMAIITEGAGKHFDPDIVEAFTHISRRLYDERTQINPIDEG